MSLRVCSRKNCALAGQARPDSDFSRDPKSSDGFRRICRKCDCAAQKARAAARQEPTFDIDVQEPAAQAPASPVAAPASPPAPVEPADPLAIAYARHGDQQARKELRREHSALLDENQRLKARIHELILMQKPPDILVYRQAENERADAVACGVASDWHVEEEVDPGAVHGLNAYNLDVAKARAERFFRNLLRLTNITARDSKITTIYLALLGDFFSGWIHKELLAANLLAPGDAARFCLGLLFSGIDFLLRESSYILEGDMIPGNHGRMTEQVHFSDPAGTSLESFMYHALAARYEGNPRVRLRVSAHAVVYRHFFEKFKMRLLHGYEVKYGGGVGGITIPLNKAIAQWDIAVRADLTVLGHFHQLFDGGNFVVNGSLIGYNTYAQAIKAKFEEARQAFFLIHARHGGQKGLTAPIWLD